MKIKENTMEDHSHCHAEHGASKAAPKGSAAKVQPGTLYICPMHPEVEQSTPGSCPICGMALEPSVVTPEQHALLLQMDGMEITVDLQACEVTAGEQRFSFEIDSFARHCLLRGMDRLDFLLQAGSDIQDFEDRV